MTDTLITFETAKLAKEKGFNEPCYWRYNEDQEITATKIGMHEQPNFYSGSYAAPSQSLLQKWLREKHNIHIWVNYYRCAWFFSLGITDIEHGMTYCFAEFDIHETYEEALEEGLKSALKLEKIKL